eukprot:TRINITY_DN2611_c0_g4_i1.p1 TRINITY_DN2611_c0_g4~~TRINITY_DN2611_c0_g4_i1.p1  ORF type:complete len:294 (-),score=46.32 TRINITY_DN2611_c0_g4_i1:21-857(-)
MCIRDRLDTLAEKRMQRSSSCMKYTINKRSNLSQQRKASKNIILKNGENSGSFEDRLSDTSQKLGVNVCNAEYKILQSYLLVLSSERTPARIVSSKGLGNLEMYFSELLSQSKGVKPKNNIWNSLWQGGKYSMAKKKSFNSNFTQPKDFYSYQTFPEKSSVFMRVMDPSLQTTLNFFPSHFHREEKRSPSERKSSLSQINSIVTLDNKRKATEKLKQKVLYDLLSTISNSSSINRKYLFTIEKLVNAFVDNDPMYLSLIHICRCRRLLTCRSRWSPYH